MIFEDLDSIEKMPILEREKEIAESSRRLPLPNSKRRSNMMLNPLKLKHINRLDSLDCDIVTLNLEDAIAPSRKKEALVNIALFVSHLKSRNSLIVIRTNPLDEGGREEIEYLADIPYDAIRLAKVKSKDEIERALAILPKDRELHISLETADAFREMSYWGDIDDRFTTANLGILDLLADMNLPQSLLKLHNRTIEYILCKFLTDSKIAGLNPVSFMYQDYKNTLAFREWCIFEKELGFTSKACMGPAQTEIANEIFDTDNVELERAKYIKDRFEEMSADGINGFMDEKYGFIDEPIYRDAVNILNTQSISAK